MFIPDPDPYFLPIPDPGAKKAPDLGSAKLIGADLNAGVSGGAGLGHRHQREEEPQLTVQQAHILSSNKEMNYNYYDFPRVKIWPKHIGIADLDPYVFGPPGSGFFYHRAKIVRKTLILTVFCLLHDFLSLKYDVNVPSKSKNRKTFLK